MFEESFYGVQKNSGSATALKTCYPWLSGYYENSLISLVLYWWGFDNHLSRCKKIDVINMMMAHYDFQVWIGMEGCVRKSLWLPEQQTLQLLLHCFWSGWNVTQLIKKHKSTPMLNFLWNLCGRLTDVVALSMIKCIIGLKMLIGAKWLCYK